jgi:hypothetical protein
MREAIVADLSTAIDAKVSSAIVDTYVRLVAEYRKGDIEGCLGAAGKFVEHTLRGIEFIRTGVAPAEIKSASATIKEIEKDTRLPEPIRLLIPRVAYAMIYDIRSKRGAVHVKEIDPRNIDAALSVQAASWVISEFLRLFHSSSEEVVAETIAALMRGYVPFVEEFGDEIIVTKQVPCDVELLLLLATTAGNGMDRRTIGQSSKYSPPAITKALGRMTVARYVHKTKDGNYHITGTDALAGDGQWLRLVRTARSQRRFTRR